VIKGGSFYIFPYKWRFTHATIVDISNPAVPVHAGSITHGTGGALLNGLTSVYVSGNYAYVASTGSDALEIIDISNPAVPVHAGSITDGTGGALLDGAQSVYVSGNYAYVASTVSDALEIIDISNPAVPVHAGSITNGTGGALLNGLTSVYVSGNYAYVASSESDALEIIDIFQPPLVSITSATADPTNVSPIEITITFNEEVTGFTADNIDVDNGTAGNLQTADNITFTADVTPSDDDVVTVVIPSIRTLRQQ